MELLDSLLAGVHEAVRAERGGEDEDAAAEAAIVRAFVEYYAEKLKVPPPPEGRGGYCTAVGEWVNSINALQEEACVESSRLIGVLGGWENEHFRWAWRNDRLFVRNPMGNEIPMSDINTWWVNQPRNERQRHPVAPIVEAWVKVATDGPPMARWY